MDDSAESRYNMIIGGYILTPLIFNLILSEHVIEGGGGPLKGTQHPWSIWVHTN